SRLGIRMGNPSRSVRRFWFAVVLTLLTLVAGLPLGGIRSQRIAQNVGGFAQLAVRSEATAEQPSDRKGIIWLPDAKWATPTGYNWAGIESDLQDMSRANIGWIRIFLRQSLSLDFLDRLVPLVAQYHIQMLPIMTKTDPSHDLGTPAQQATYRAWI